MKKNYAELFFKRIQIFYLVVFASLAMQEVKGQMVYIPDSMFRVKLTNLGFGSCFVGDSIDSSCPLILNTTQLDVSHFGITDLQGIQLFTNLQILDCSYNSLGSLPALPNSLKYFTCSGDSLVALPLLPDSLKYIDCGHNQIQSIQNLMLLNNLESFICNGNQLTSLPLLPDSLKILICSDNQIQTIQNLSLLNNLETFNCVNDQLTSLPLLPNTLKALGCSGNLLGALPAHLPDSLLDLTCSNNNLGNLPVLPTGLRSLVCSYDNLTSLPVLPASLNTLSCDNQSLVSLPNLPPSLQYIWCEHNNITQLPQLPLLIHTLSCGNNLLTTLPALPNSLSDIWCEYNNLINLPALPDHLYYLTLTGNPNLTCFPLLKGIEYLEFSGTGITCLPNYGNVTFSTPSILSLPLCGLFNSNGCPLYWNISGKSYFDSNNNCQYNSGDVSQGNMHILLFQNGVLMQQVFTRVDGFYSFDVNNNFGICQTVLDSSNILFDVLCPVNNSYIDTIGAIDSLAADRDFAMRCKNGFDIGAYSIVSNHFQAARHSGGRIEVGDIANFYGVHCANGISGTVTITISGPVTYLSPDTGALIPSNVTGNILTYNIADFGTVDLFRSFNIILSTDTFAVIGSSVCISVAVSPLIGDNNPTNNSLTHCFTVVGSIDPNDKEVDPIGDVDLAGNGWLTYTIHFQNTGSAPAEHIYILDTLDQNLDLSTFQLLAYSHQPFVQILNGGIAKFNFPNINLPDSINNEPGSHGYIQYKIKLKSTAIPGSQVSNRAYIYFDFNNPVATNTTSNNITSTVGMSAVSNNVLQFSLFPNPGKDEFTVYCPQCTSSKKVILTLLDLFGKEAFSAEMKSTNYQLHAAGLASGIYFLRIESGGGAVVRKLVKE